MTVYQPLTRSYWAFMYESDLALSVGRAVASYPNEVPMSTFGLQTHRGDFVVLVVAPPGEGAVMHRSSCQQSPDYVDRVARLLKKDYGVDFLGDLHSHGEHALPTPSTGDLRTLSSLARRNAIPRLFQGIISFEKLSLPLWNPRRRSTILLDRLSHCPMSQGAMCSVSAFSRLRPIVNSFVLVRTESGEYEYQPSSVVLLPGKSPIGVQLEQSGLDQSLGLAFASKPYPIDWIDIRRLLKRDEAPTPLPSAASFLLKECRELPDAVAQLTEIYCQGGSWIVRIPLNARHHLFLVYVESSNAIPQLDGVFLREEATHSISEILEEASDSRGLTSVIKVYQKAHQLLHNEDRAFGDDQSKLRTVADVATDEEALHGRLSAPLNSPNMRNCEPKEDSS